MIAFLTYLIYFVIIFALISLSIDMFLASKGYKGPKSDHFDGTKFHSYHSPVTKDAQEHTGLNNQKSVFKWLLTRPKAIWAWRENTQHTIPEKSVEGNKIVTTFINHSTVLIQTAGINILCDPIWSKRTSPNSFIGPARFRNPGITLEELPPIHVVLISHNHYDHMDVGTLRWLAKKWNPKILVGLGNAEFLRTKGIDGVTDMDWWDHDTIGLSNETAIKIVCAPGQHFSSRALSDRNKTLWCGFIVETSSGPIYFAGDTGYGSFVEKIKEKYPSGFKLAFLPIGAFKPEWFMGPVHISPSQALQIHKELNVQTSIAIHFGTFHLADDSQDEAPQRLKELLAKETSLDFRVLDNGEAAKF
jgi:L-ascorbate metabolism protein UlaG (beta-lactamase superfamily)